MLFRSEQLSHRFVVSDIGLAAGISPSTALRYLVRLEADGFVKRHADPHDRRRVFVTLTPSSKAILKRIFEMSLKANALKLAA